MKPIVGVTSSFDWEKKVFTLPSSYICAVEEAGGVPVLLPPSMKADFEILLESVDGVILTGGVDVDPVVYGEAPIPMMGKIDPLRDHFEISLARRVLEVEKPLLAICRGIQVLNVAAGGTLYQDINGQIDDSFKHNQKAPTQHPTHKVRVKTGSRLHGIFKKKELMVNSFHHQAVKNLGRQFLATAWSDDGVVEAMESEDNIFVLGVQWHPERMIEGEMIKIFEAFISELI